ncbi:MAG: DUF5681 domain-containing protein [Elusimicrobiota bacterium]|jgi:hypothetical protein|nr:DUF5681 domain-containing protein [Elusimicrobiota bacterium]
MTNDYEIGYCKPPFNTRFKGGQSGNHKGRPKGQPKKEGIIELLGKELKTKLILKDGSKITKEEALVRQLCNKASSGDFRSGKLILDFANRQKTDNLAVEFFKRLIKDKVVTEKNVADYVNGAKLLELERLPLALSELYNEWKRSYADSWLAIMDVLMLMHIWQYLTALLVMKDIVRVLNAEQAFWNGFEMALEGVSSEKKRKQLLAQAEASRKYKKTDTKLYKLAESMDKFMVLATINMLVGMRNQYEKAVSYEKAREGYFRPENCHDVSLYAELYFTEKYHFDKENEKNVEEFADDQEEGISQFEELPGEGKDFNDLRAKLKKEDIYFVFRWYGGIAVEVTDLIYNEITNDNSDMVIVSLFHSRGQLLRNFLIDQMRGQPFEEYDFEGEMREDMRRYKEKERAKEEERLEKERAEEDLANMEVRTGNEETE